jgi:hypothetical protein
MPDWRSFDGFWGPANREVSGLGWSPEGTVPELDTSVFLIPADDKVD